MLNKYHLTENVTISTMIYFCLLNFTLLNIIIIIGGASTIQVSVKYFFLFGGWGGGVGGRSQNIISAFYNLIIFTNSRASNSLVDCMSSLYVYDWLIRNKAPLKHTATGSIMEVMFTSTHINITAIQMELKANEQFLVTHTPSKVCHHVWLFELWSVVIRKKTALSPHPWMWISVRIKSVSRTQV